MELILFCIFFSFLLILILRHNSSPSLSCRPFLSSLASNYCFCSGSAFNSYMLDNVTSDTTSLTKCKLLALNVFILSRHSELSLHSLLNAITVEGEPGMRKSGALERTGCSFSLVFADRC